MTEKSPQSRNLSAEDSAAHMRIFTRFTSWPANTFKTYLAVFKPPTSNKAKQARYLPARIWFLSASGMADAGEMNGDPAGGAATAVPRFLRGAKGASLSLG